MRLSEERKAVLTVALDALNKTVGGKMSEIIAAEAEVKKHLPKIGLYLEFSDYINRWFFADRNGDEVDLTTDLQRKMNKTVETLSDRVLDLKNDGN